MEAEDRALIPEGIELPISTCVRFETVPDEQYALRRGTYHTPDGTTILVLAGSHVANADRMDREVLAGLRFWALVLPPNVIEPLLMHEDEYPEPARDAVKKSSSGDEFDPVREDLEAIDPELLELTDIVFRIKVEDPPERDDQYLLWSVDPEIRDGHGHRYGNANTYNAKASIDLDKYAHSRVKITRRDRADLYVGPKNPADRFAAPDGCTVWGAAAGDAVWSEYHLLYCGSITSRIG